MRRRLACKFGSSLDVAGEDDDTGRAGASELCVGRSTRVNLQPLDSALGCICLAFLVLVAGRSCPALADATTAAQIGDSKSDDRLVGCGHVLPARGRKCMCSLLDVVVD